MPTEQRWALITGAAQRTGAHLARGLAAQGYGLHLHTHTRDPAPLARTLRAEAGIPVRTHRVDLADTEAVRTWAHHLRTGPCPPSLVVNNASPFPPPHHVDDLGLLEEGLRVHLMAPVLLHAALPEEGGHVVNMLDARLSLLDGVRPGYEVSKHALAAHTLLAARRLAPHVRVNAIAPGLLLPPPGHDEKHLRALARQRSCLGHPAQPDDVVAALLFLEQARSVTGQIIHVDSGEHLGGNETCTVADLKHPSDSDQG
ncbi:SDR family oxidoreductase [Nocardiopsis sp. FR4]|uniref:SDR family oxidoreductase n=1 Tax=Nocardiopsis sp. FR4 TaxID=2605985 RepID=UPI001F386C0F|nr:SDR family oxidoreductase [Nocardiopsis sp. FR4]